MGAEPKRPEYNVQLQGKSTQNINRFLKSLKLNSQGTVTNKCVVFILKWRCEGLHQGWPVAEANQAAAYSHALSWRLQHTKYFAFSPFCLFGGVTKTILMLKIVQHLKDNVGILQPRPYIPIFLC